jgi:hypothetical protein
VTEVAGLCRRDAGTTGGRRRRRSDGDCRNACFDRPEEFGSEADDGAGSGCGIGGSGRIVRTLLDGSGMIAPSVKSEEM